MTIVEDLLRPYEQDQSRRVALEAEAAEEIQLLRAECNRLQSLVDIELHPVAEVVSVDFIYDTFVTTTSTKSKQFSYLEVRLVPGVGMPPGGTKLYQHPFKNVYDRREYE